MLYSLSINSNTHNLLLHQFSPETLSAITIFKVAIKRKKKGKGREDFCAYYVIMTGKTQSLPQPNGHAHSTAMTILL